MGILIGWIIQKQRMTFATFLLWLIGIFTLPRLPRPFGYLVFLLPLLFLMALLYEGSAQFGLRLGPRLRMAWALWMGLSTAVLMAGIVLGGSTFALFVASVAVFAVLAAPSTIAVGLVHARRLREESSASPLTGGAATKGKNV